MNLLKIHGSIDWFRGDDQKIHRRMASDKKAFWLDPRNPKQLKDPRRESWGFHCFHI